VRCQSRYDLAAKFVKLEIRLFKIALHVSQFAEHFYEQMN